MVPDPVSLGDSALGNDDTRATPTKPCAASACSLHRCRRQTDWRGERNPTHLRRLELRLRLRLRRAVLVRNRPCQL
eukprot:7390779-Prymnesium_polylepis.1